MIENSLSFQHEDRLKNDVAESALKFASSADDRVLTYRFEIAMDSHNGNKRLPPSSLDALTVVKASMP
jgi:hypothetical protein